MLSISPLGKVNKVLSKQKKEELEFRGFEKDQTLGWLRRLRLSVGAFEGGIVSAGITVVGASYQDRPQ